MASEVTPSAASLLCSCEHGLLVEGHAHAAVDGHPLRHLEPQMPRHQRRRLDDADVVELVLALAPDLERVAEALGGDEASGAPLRSISALENSVVACTRRPMSAGAMALSTNSRSIPVMTPRAGSSCVVSSLRLACRPVAAS